MEKLTKPKKTVEELADEHVEWLINLLIPIIRRIGKDEFIHGYKHGRKEKRR